MPIAINRCLTRGSRYRTLGLILCLGALWTGAMAWGQESPFAGSSSCRECHEEFYELWAPSHHGKAMQPYTQEFAQTHLTPHVGEIQIGDYRYQAAIKADHGVLVETGPQGRKEYPIQHVLGGKNVFYFLTPWQGGRLQTLPLAYDVHKRQWFDTAASGVRHFPGQDQDEPVHWTDPLYTFNTSCYGCHVSQLSSNYDLKTDTYHTQWAEPGINCETCHGPSQRHVELYQEAEKTETEPNELGLVSTHSFTVEQTNSMCNSCHAKMSPITPSFMAGERFFDHYDLVTLENSDFYPDGRDLGENYTMTTWRMSPCMQAGELDCMHCHTSSGRYRFKDPAQASGACLPCHQDKVDHITEHSHHEPGEHTPQCISCHMPMTQFAHMNRTDHSMRPPVPAATLKYESDNACNLCHQAPDQDAAWAQQQVTEWGMTTRQERYLRLADYIDQARQGRWQQLDQMLDSLQQPDRDEIVTGSLIRLLRRCDSPQKWPFLIEVLQQDPSAFVRATAAEALDSVLTTESVPALLKATQDDYRLVRVRAAASLASMPPGQLSEDQQSQLDRALAELMEGMIARADDYGSHYNLGNVYMEQRKFDQALEAYQTSIKLRSDFVPPHVNAAFVYHAQGKNAEAEQSFRRALALDPNNLITLTNLAMLVAELNRPQEAKALFLKAAKLDPNDPVPAYNLGILLAQVNPTAALAWCQKAYVLQPDNGKYGYTYAYYLVQQGDVDPAVALLEKQIADCHATVDAYWFLASYYRSQQQWPKVKQVLHQALAHLELSPQDREVLQRQLRDTP